MKPVTIIMMVPGSAASLQMCAQLKEIANEARKKEWIL